MTQQQLIKNRRVFQSFVQIPAAIKGDAHIPHKNTLREVDFTDKSGERKIVG